MIRVLYSYIVLSQSENNEEITYRNRRKILRGKACNKIYLNPRIFKEPIIVCKYRDKIIIHNYTARINYLLQLATRRRTNRYLSKQVHTSNIFIK